MDFFRQKAQRSAEAKLDAEVEGLNRLLEDEAYQLSLMPPSVVRQAIINGSTDAVPGHSGRFGFVPTNPVPVNGTVGAMAWLSRLQTKHGESMVFHRLGCIRQIEAYEAVTLVRKHWYVFFVDPTYTGASEQAPSGFTLLPMGRQFHGVGTIMRNFPHEFADIVGGYSDEFRLASVAPNKVLGFFSDGDTLRPLAQRLKLEWIAEQISIELVSGSPVPELA